MRAIVLVLALWCSTFVPLAGAAADDCGSGRDAGDAPARSPVLLAGPGACAGALGGSDDADYYLVDAPADTLVKVRVEGDHATNLCVDGYGISDYRCDFGDPGLVYTVWRLTDGPMTLGIRVFGIAADGPYTLDVSFLPPVAQDDCGAGRDAGPRTQTSWGIPTVGTCEGRVGTQIGDYADTFLFHAEAGTEIVVADSALPAWSVGVCLRPLASHLCAAGGERPGHVEVPVETSGTWELTVSTYEPDARYTLTLRDASDQDDCGSRVDVGAGWGKLLAHDEECRGTFDRAAGDVFDRYALAAPDDGAHLIFLTPDDPAADFRVCARDTFQDHVRCEHTAPLGRAVLLPHPFAGGSFRLTLDALAGDGGYSLALLPLCRDFWAQTECSEASLD